MALPARLLARTLRPCRRCPRAAQAARLRGGPASCGRRQALRPHAVHAGRRGGAIGGGRHGRAAPCTAAAMARLATAVATSASLGGRLAAASRRPERLRCAANGLACVSRGKGARLVQCVAGVTVMLVRFSRCSGYAHAWHMRHARAYSAPRSGHLCGRWRGHRRRQRPRQRAQSHRTSSRGR